MYQLNVYSALLYPRKRLQFVHDMLHRTDYTPFGIASFPILDQVKRLDGAKRGQQLPALVVSQVVGEAAHKDTLIGIYHLQQQSCCDFWGYCERADRSCHCHDDERHCY